MHSNNGGAAMTMPGFIGREAWGRGGASTLFPESLVLNPPRDSVCERAQ